MSLGTTLYYPYIHPRKIGDLKAALLYWDRVRRIVPKSAVRGDYAVDDDRECKSLVDGELLVSTLPEHYEAAAAEAFFRHIEPHRGRLTIDLKAAREMANRNRGIHIEKIGQSVLAKMKELDLAQRFGDWVYMHDRAGALYMFCLASEISNKISAPLLADSEDEADVGEAMLFEPKAADAVSETLVQLGIELPSGDALARVPVKKFLTFCEKRAPEKTAFREHIEGIVATARATPDPNALADYIAGQQTRIKTAVKDLRDSLDDIKVAGVTSFAKITVPAGVGAAITSLALPPSAAAILGGLGVAISAISCFAETRGKLRQARSSASSPYHYLLSVEKEFGRVKKKKTRAR